MTEILKDKRFFIRLFTIALPIAFQNLITSSLNMIDTVMIGKLGGVEIAAVGAANRIFFLMSLILFGMSSGASIFTSQYWGKEDVKNIRRIVGLNLLAGLIASFIFSLVALFFPEQILRIFSEDLAVIQSGSAYLRVVAISYIFTAITYAYVFTLRSTGEVRLQVIISIISICINAFFNWVLIFGTLGFPEMGVKGAALATVIARIVECIVLVIIVYRRNYAVAARWKEMTDITWEFTKNFFQTISTVVLNEFTWAIGVTMYSVIYGRMGTDTLAAMNIAATVEQVAMVLFMGMGSAAAVMLGNEIGASEYERTYVYAKRLLIIGPIFALFIGGIVIILSPYILSVFNIDAVVNDYAQKSLIVFSLYMWVKVFNLINVVGVLRSGGDSRFTFLLDMMGVWFIAVPLGFLTGLVLEWPIYLVYASILFEEVVKMILGMRRVKSKKWLKTVVG